MRRCRDRGRNVASHRRGRLGWSRNNLATAADDSSDREAVGDARRKNGGMRFGADRNVTRQHGRVRERGDSLPERGECRVVGLAQKKHHAPGRQRTTASELSGPERNDFGIDDERYTRWTILLAERSDLARARNELGDREITGSSSEGPKMRRGDKRRFVATRTLGYGEQLAKLKPEMTEIISQVARTGARTKAKSEQVREKERTKSAVAK